MVQSRLTAASTSWVQWILVPQPLKVAGITGVRHHTWLYIYIAFLGEMGFHHVGQAGLKLLASSDPPASAFQSAGITDVNHHGRLILKGRLVTITTKRHSFQPSTY